jgi:hypothetical protein
MSSASDFTSITVLDFLLTVLYTEWGRFARSYSITSGGAKLEEF